MFRTAARRFPIALFPILLGLMGIGLALRRGVPLGVPAELSELWLGMASALLLVASLFYGARLAMDPRAIFRDLAPPPARAAASAGAMAWLLWGAAFGLPAPLIDHLPPNMQTAITALLLTAAATNGAIWIAAVAKTKRPRLYKWIFAMLVYFPLATLAAFKGMIEIAVAPFYWDKTRHGRTAEGISHGVEIPAPDTAEI